MASRHITLGGVVVSVVLGLLIIASDSGLIGSAAADTVGGDTCTPDNLVSTTTVSPPDDSAVSATDYKYQSADGTVTDFVEPNPMGSIDPTTLSDDDILFLGLPDKPDTSGMSPSDANAAMQSWKTEVEQWQSPGDVGLCDETGVANLARDSIHWAGTEDANGHFTEVEAQPRLPTLSAQCSKQATGKAAAISEWVGIGGDNGDAALLQSGYQAGDTGSWVAFWEALENNGRVLQPHVLNKFPVSAGDSVWAQTEYFKGSNAVRFGWKDVTTQSQVFTKPIYTIGGDPASDFYANDEVEAIVERPGILDKNNVPTGGYLNLRSWNSGEAHIIDAKATGARDGWLPLRNPDRTITNYSMTSNGLSTGSTIAAWEKDAGLGEFFVADDGCS